MRRAVIVAVIGALASSPVGLAQLPRPTFAWWSSPIAQDLKLSDEQRKQIRLTIKDYRPRLLELRASLERAESDLEAEFNQSSVDTRKANDAIDRFASARGDLTRTLSQMSLKLRTVLKAEQWEELQRKLDARAQEKKAGQP
ncbi:MAG: Spy/CpxP family protein refolding chaperone [Bryobacteraceae bacterium]